MACDGHGIPHRLGSGPALPISTRRPVNQPIANAAQHRHRSSRGRVNTASRSIRAGAWLHRCCASAEPCPASSPGCTTPGQPHPRRGDRGCPLRRLGAHHDCSASAKTPLLSNDSGSPPSSPASASCAGPACRDRSGFSSPPVPSPGPAKARPFRQGLGAMTEINTVALLAARRHCGSEQAAQEGRGCVIQQIADTCSGGSGQSFRLIPDGWSSRFW